MKRRTQTNTHTLSAGTLLCRTQAGFTIVEVMVAVIVFAVGLTAISGMQTRSIEQSTLSDQMTMRINAITHRAETMKRMPVMDETVGIDGGVQIDVTVNGVYEEENMCGYGTTCEWNYVQSEKNKSHRLRQRVVEGYPLPELVMVELEAIPQGLTTAKTEKRTVRLSYVRSTRWN